MSNLNEKKTDLAPSQQLGVHSSLIELRELTTQLSKIAGGMVGIAFKSQPGEKLHRPKPSVERIVSMLSDISRLVDKLVKTQDGISTERIEYYLTQLRELSQQQFTIEDQLKGIIDSRRNRIKTLIHELTALRGMHLFNVYFFLKM